MKKTLIAAGLFSVASIANAHVSFVANNAYAGKSYVATANIPHGCEDDAGNKYDTIKIEMSIPAGFTSVRPADATFGPASVEKDEAGNVTKMIWTKTAAAATSDDFLYQVTFRGTLPANALQSLAFTTTQTCAGDQSFTWEGTDAPALKVLPVRNSGWNKYTAQTALDEATIKAYFADAQIVWSNGAAYSANSVTNGLIITKLTSIAQGAEYWVKY
jgi:hypothetical protein